MFKAEHERMFQEANQGIIEIRKSEIEFYLRVSSALGTQAALVGGFTYLTFSQNLETEYVYTYTMNATYYVTAAMTIAFAIHVILTTMLVQILGPGLALNGPVGSMARAVEGMRIEQKQILGSFFLMMFFFALSTLLLFWVTMDMYSSVIATAGFLSCARYWFYYCGRIYRRFYWDKTTGPAGQWRNSSADSIDEPVIPITFQQTEAIDSPMQGQADLESSGSIRPSMLIRPSKANKATTSTQQQQPPVPQEPTDIDRERPTILERISMVGGGNRLSLVERVSNIFMPGNLKKVDPMDYQPTSATTNRPSFYQPPYQQQPFSERSSFAATRPSFTGFVIPPGAVTVNPKDIACQGFIVMNTAPKGLLKQKHKWDRRYVVLNFRGQLFYYFTKQDFKSDPHSHINPRPLSLDDFFVSIDKSLESGSDNATMVSGTMTGTMSSGLESPLLNAGNIIERFWFTLIPKDDERYRNWQYRTDTEEELDMWLTAMRQVSPSSFRSDV